MVATIRFHAPGAPDVLVLEDVPAAPLGDGDIRIRHTAIGFNFIDVTYRTGGIKTPSLPSAIGFEAAGVVLEVGRAVTQFKTGDRVAYATAGMGAYAAERVVPAARVVAIPAGVTDEQAAAVLFKGLTAWYLIHRTFPVKPGSIVVNHAAAGGVGIILGAWAKALGARVFGTVGNRAKVQTALDAGYEKVFVLGEDDVLAGLTAATGGHKAHVVYDSVGKDTFALSLDLLRRFGMAVSYGAASGAPPAVEIGTLNAKGCLFVTRPSVFPHTEDPADLVEGATQVFRATAAGILPIAIGGRYPLKDAAKLHADVAARKTTGSLILLP